MYYRGRFDFFNPLTFAAWSYVFPAFVGGGLIIAFGAVNPYFMTFVDDPEYNLPLSLVYVGVGFLGMWLGFSLPVGRYIAEKLERLIPDWQWKPSEVWVPGIVLLSGRNCGQSNWFRSGNNGLSADHRHRYIRQRTIFSRNLGGIRVYHSLVWDLYDGTANRGVLFSSCCRHRFYTAPPGIIGEPSRTFCQHSADRDGVWIFKPKAEASDGGVSSAYWSYLR